MKDTSGGYFSTITHFAWFSRILLSNFAFCSSTKGADHLLLSESSLKQMLWEGLTDKFDSTLGNFLKHFISLIVKGFVKEAPGGELVFALKQLFEEVSLTNFNSTLDNSIKDCISLIVFFNRRCYALQSSYFDGLTDKNFRKIHYKLHFQSTFACRGLCIGCITEGAVHCTFCRAL